MPKTPKDRTTACPSPTDAILESISDGVFTVDLDWRITSFNRAAEEITGVSRRQAIGQFCRDVFRSTMCGDECPLRRTMDTGRPVIGQSGYIITSAGNKTPISVSTAVLRDSEGRITGGAETFRDLGEVEALRQAIRGGFRMGDLVSQSFLMQRIFEVLPAIAASPSTVLILGETGTGKELLAKAIHDLSRKSKGPFVAVNCGAIPDTLLESELFGYKKGAFTGAEKDKPGLFARARGGTIFLDEIGDISSALQTRLLRVLQEKTYEPLGATRSETSDARVVVATNKDLTELTRKGLFREDLYYRINVVRVELPPLRRRKEDIPLLADHFISRFNRVQGKTISGISAEALSLLMAYDWPGNVRELENAIEHAFILCRGEKLEIAHLPQALTARGAQFQPSSGLQESHEMLDSQAIEAALLRNGLNRTMAAAELGIHKTTLFRKIKKLGIALPQKDGRAGRKINQ